MSKAWVAVVMVAAAFSVFYCLKLVPPTEDQPLATFLGGASVLLVLGVCASWFRPKLSATVLTMTGLFLVTQLWAWFVATRHTSSSQIHWPLVEFLFLLCSVVLFSVVLGLLCTVVKHVRG